MRFLFALILALCTGAPALAAARITATHQQEVVIINTTPHQIVEFSLWLYGFDAEMSVAEDGHMILNPVVGSIDPFRAVSAYVEAGFCLVHAAASTENGKLFSADLNLCSEHTTWVIDDSVSL